MSNDYPQGPPPPPPPPPPQQPWQSFDPYGGASRPPQPPPPPVQQYQPPAPAPKGGIGKTLLIVVLVIGLMVAVCCIGGIAWVAYVGGTPGTAVVSGSQVDAKHLRKLESLGMIKPGEKILHFYSDALTDLETGAYVATEKQVVLYNNTWRTAKIAVPYETIVKVEFAKSSDLFQDSQVYLHLSSTDEVYSFPLSNENGGDDRFIETIKKLSPNLVEVKESVATGF